MHYKKHWTLIMNSTLFSNVSTLSVVFELTSGICRHSFVGDNNWISWSVKESYKFFFEISFHVLHWVLDPKESIDIKISWKFGFLPGHLVSFNLNIRHHKTYTNSIIYCGFLKYILSVLLNNMVPDIQIKTNEMTRQKSEFSSDFYINRFSRV